MSTHNITISSPRGAWKSAAGLASFLQEKEGKSVLWIDLDFPVEQAKQQLEPFGLTNIINVTSPLDVFMEVIEAWSVDVVVIHRFDLVPDGMRESLEMRFFQDDDTKYILTTQSPRLGHKIPVIEMSPGASVGGTA